MTTPTMRRIQRVEETTAEVFLIGDATAVDVGDFLALDASATGDYNSPTAAAYTDTTGETNPLGVATRKLIAKLDSDDTLYRVGWADDHDRYMGVMTRGRLYTMNFGPSGISPGEAIAPYASGIQKKFGDMVQVGRSEQHIATGKWGLVRLEVD